MNYLDGFRNPAAASALREQLESLGGRADNGSPATRIMEVCGSHTMAVGRYAIRSILPAGTELISGPGCPVCVTGAGYIDTAIALAEQGCMIVTFGDMMRVPGSSGSLAEVRAGGASVDVAYSPSGAADLARRHPERDVVFLGIGFETTIGPVVSLVETAKREGMRNLSLLTAFKLVPPALTALLADPGIRIDAFLCPPHVSAIIGASAYEPFARDHGVPCVIAGFEPLDILYGILGILQQKAEGATRVDNQYARVVRPHGNARAQALIDRYLEPEDALWRGMGRIPASGLVLRPEFRDHDARHRFGIDIRDVPEPQGCRCGDVIKGKIPPTACALFAGRCTPTDPVGPCMVSSEGTCAAYYKYERSQA